MSAASDRKSVVSLTQALAWVATLVFCLGVPRFVVVCNGPHCDSRIELAHDESACCERTHADADHDAADHAAADHGATEHEAEFPGPRAGSDHECSDAAFVIGNGPLPRAIGIELDSTGAIVPPPIAAHDDARAPCIALRPPAAGPPQDEQRLRQLETVVLLI